MVDIRVSLIEAINNCNTHMHEHVAAFIQSLEGVSLTKNKNGYFVDLCKLSDTQVQAISETVKALIASGADRSGAEVHAAYDSVGTVEAPVEGSSVPDTQGSTVPSTDVTPMGCINATSQQVMRHIDDIIKKHIPPQPSEPLKKKGTGTYKRTMVVTNRKLEAYEPKINDLHEENVCSDDMGAAAD